MARRSTDFTPSLDASDVDLSDVGDSVAEPITTTAFWSAIALPFLHLPLLLATGLSDRSTAIAFVVLVALNVIALLIGHSRYRN